MVNTGDSRRAQPLRLTAQLLIAAYCQGVFPMARSRHATEVDWYSPNPRAVLPLDGFDCPRSLRAVISKKHFEVRHDSDFAAVIGSCAMPRHREHDTWINDQIIQSFTDLHSLGLAHSVEAWRDDRLVGGLYGVALGGAFFGESMFHRADLGGTDASKACLAHLVNHLRARRFVLLDVQINSPHMARFGTLDIPRKQYLAQLEEALKLDVAW
jgi:leucyl/phenylalanyl-tRNA--protein transferase